MADDTKDTRSIIKNATLGGIDKEGAGVMWKGNTIATKDEIDASKSKVETPKLWGLSNIWPKLWTVSWLGWLRKAENTPKSEVVSQPKVSSPIQEIQSGWSVSLGGQPSSPFENSMNTPIDVDVTQIGGEDLGIRTQPIDVNIRKAEKPISSLLNELEKDKKKRISEGVESLYIDAYNRNVKGGSVRVEEILNNPKYQEQFKGIDEKLLSDMVEDANYLAQFDYNTENVLALMDKYKELGLEMDLDNLPPQTKAQYIAESMEWGWGLWGALDHISPFNILWSGVEVFTGKNPRDYNEKLQQWAEGNKQDFLTDAEVNEMIKDQIAQLDKKYKDYYTNDAELVDKDLQKKVDLEMEKWLGTQMVTTPEQREAKRKEIEEKLGYTNLEREGKNWTDKEKKKEYEQEVRKLEKEAKKQHWDTFGRWWKNLWLDAVYVVSQGIDLVRNPGSLASWMLNLAQWAVGKSVEGYADLLDTAIATAGTLVDKDKQWEGVQYKVWDIYEKYAERKGFESVDNLISRMEQASEGNPWLKLATWYLKEAEKDLATANAFGDYIKASYGSWENAEQMAKENPVQMASDIISIIQLGTLWAAKMWLIDAAKAEQIVKIAWYGDLYEQTLKWGNKLQFWPLLKGEMAVAKAWAKVVGAPFKFAKPVLETFVNRLSGLTKEERALLKQNPELVEKYLSWKENSQGLLDRILNRFNGLMEEKKFEGEEYEKIHQSNAPVLVKNILDDASKILKKYGAEMAEDGSIKITRSYTPAIDKKIQELGQFLQDIRELGNKATAEDAHWLRQQIDTLKKWEWNPTWIEWKADMLFGDIRKAVDKEIRRAVPELKEVDARYIKTKEAIADLRQDWIGKDGNLKDSAYSKIRNITNKGANEPKLARLEELLPGITEELKGLAVAESVEKAGKQMVGQYASQIFGVGGWIAAITGLLSGWLSAWPIVLWVLWATLATPKNLVKLLKYQGKISNGFNKIIEKLSNWIKLTEGETLSLTRFLNDNEKNLKKDAEYLYRKGLITDEEYKAALKNKEKEVKTTWKESKKEYNAEESKIWEETENPETWKPYTKEEVDKKVVEIRDRILGDKKKLRELYDRYKVENEELKDAEVEKIFDKNGYINPDGLRGIINEMIAKELGVSENILASTNHPAVSKIADEFVEMVGDDMVKQAKNGNKITVAVIWGGWGSWKSGWPKAMISEGFVKKWDKVNMTLDVQGWADDLEKIIRKAEKEWVLDKFEFKVAYVYASTEDAGMWAINRTINQNVRWLERKWYRPEDVKNAGISAKNNLYAWRSLPFKVFEQGHLKSIGEKKGLKKFVDMANKMDNMELMITERIPGDRKNTVKHIVKQWGEFKMSAEELDSLLEKITANKEAGLNWKLLKREGKRALKNGEISERQYYDMFGKEESQLAFLLMLIGWKIGGRSENLA